MRHCWRYVVFQQDNAPTRCSHDTVEFLFRDKIHSLIVICGQPALIAISYDIAYLKYNRITSCFKAVYFLMKTI